MIVVLILHIFRYVSRRLPTYAHDVHAEQPPMSDADGLISFDIETFISIFGCCIRIRY